MNTVNISLPESLKSFVDERVAEGGYRSTSEYLQELIRSDERAAAAARLRGLIEEGLACGPGRDTDLVLEEMRAKLRQPPRT